ncbi:recombinase family protein [Micromonospora sp. NPDC048868]|uniref:recombinase family protein n=1 Tax=Micromonospora sp. NPDC048868 TaxID=3364258 RepID=UPI0037205F78
MPPGISYATARRRYESGTLPVPSYRLGRLIMVGEPLTGAMVEVGQTVVYARVSSADQEADLDRQVARVATWATGQRLSVDCVVTEVGSVLNGHRKEFLALLRHSQVTTIVVDPAEVDDDLVRDVTEILTMLCARLYGRRAAANRARHAVEAVTEDPA